MILPGDVLISNIISYVSLSVCVLFCLCNLCMFATFIGVINDDDDDDEYHLFDFCYFSCVT